MRIIKFGGIVNMGKKLAIKGHSTRGKEVIELLEMLGGVNADSHKGNFPDEWKSSYYIYRDNTIQFGRDEFLLKLKFVIFTLEEFLEKYPYKVGDIVKTGKDEEGVIKQMRWVNNDIVYWVNSHKNCDWTQTLSVDVLDKYNRLKLNDIEYNMETKVESTGFMQLGKTFAVIFNDANYEDEVELQLGDYEIEVRNGKTYAVKKKPVYPNTYEECYDEDNIELHFIYVDKNERDLYESLIQLIRCRNAYWKIAGEQMGLGKPWEPNWTTFEGMPAIFRFRYNIVCDSIKDYHCLLVFPTKEMRDAFYENFKDLIEECKEFL